MVAQRLRDRVAFERLGPGVSDGAGNIADSWGLMLDCSARLRPINGREEVLAAKLSGVMAFELIVRRCRAIGDLTSADRVRIVRSHQLAADTPLDIVTIQNSDERGVWLSMLVKSGVASG